jgi:hypothetical protein
MHDKNNCVSTDQISCEIEENHQHTFSLFCDAYGEGG